MKKDVPDASGVYATWNLSKGMTSLSLLWALYIFPLNVESFRRCVRQKIFTHWMTRRIARNAKEGLTQRRNVKAQVKGDAAMGRLTVTGLTGFSATNAPFDDKGAIATC